MGEMDSMTTEINEPKNKKGYLFFKGPIWAFLTSALTLVVGISAFRSVFEKESTILESYNLISPDGFDWILEGRALSKGIFVGWPELRNLGFVIVSSLDATSGGHGLAFGLASALGVMLQLIAIVILMRTFNVRWPIVFASSLVFALGPMHFISVYILSDSIATGLLAISTALLTIGIVRKSLLISMTGLTLSFAGSLMQMYGLAAIPGFVIALYVYYQTKQIRLSRFLILLAASILTIGLFWAANTAWNLSITHQTRPLQLELLKFSTNMLPFYSNVWATMYLPWLVLFAFALFRHGISFVARTTRAISTNPSILILVSTAVLLIAAAFFYQWPESRFSYSYFWSLAALISILAFGTVGKELNKYGVAGVAFVWLLFSCIWSLLCAPTNYWAPVVGSYQNTSYWWNMGKNSGSPYSWFEQKTAETCKGSAGIDPNQIGEWLAQRPDPSDAYGASIATFGWTFCSAPAINP